MVDNEHVFFWATVESVSPLTVRRDGETAPLGAGPSSLVNLGNATAGLDLAEGDRVWCQLQNRRALIIGRAGGLPRDGTFYSAMPGKPGMYFAANRTDSSQGPGLWFSQEGTASGSDAALWITKAGSTETADAEILNVRGPSDGEISMRSHTTFQSRLDAEYNARFYDLATFYDRVNFHDPVTFNSEPTLKSGLDVSGRSDFHSSVFMNSTLVYGGRPDTTSSANLHISSGNMIYRSSSARSEKVNIEDAPDISERLLELNPRVWLDRTELVERLGDKFSEYVTEDDGQSGPQADTQQLGGVLGDEYPRKVLGLVAEEVHDAGLEHAVTWSEDEDGNERISGIAYDRLWTLLIPLVRQQREQISDLEDRVERLESLLDNGDGGAT